MSKIFTPIPASAPAHDLLASIIRDHHPDLAEAGLSIGLIFVASTGTAPALRHHGWPAQAIVRNESAENRAKGAADATITIDKANWDDLTADQRRALLDHEVTHIELRRDRKSGAVKRDDKDRPLVKLLPHDYECAGFRAVAERYGDDSPEVRAMDHLRTTYGQLLLFEGLDVDREPKSGASGAGKRRRSA